MRFSWIIAQSNALAGAARRVDRFALLMFARHEQLHLHLVRVLLQQRVEFRRLKLVRPGQLDQECVSELGWLGRGGKPRTQISPALGGDGVDLARRPALLDDHLVGNHFLPVQFHERSVDLVVVAGPVDEGRIRKELLDVIPRKWAPAKKTENRIFDGHLYLPELDLVKYDTSMLLVT